MNERLRRLAERTITAAKVRSSSAFIATYVHVVSHKEADAWCQLQQQTPCETPHIASCSFVIT